MKHRIEFSNLPLLALFMALTSTALASSTWYVDGVNGSNNNNCKTPQAACKTIKRAISLASSGDSIMVAAATYTENLKINLSMKLIGSGANTTIIDGGGVNTVVTISNANAHVTLSKLTIRNGVAVNGGGINYSGTLTINNSTVSGNVARGTVSAPGNGGGIFGYGTLTIASSTVSGNSATASGLAQGGGIFGGSVTINNSTISGNSASAEGGFGAHGGGIYNYFSALTINNSTVSGNGASSGNGKANGGGIYGPGAILQNSIVANSSSGGNCFGTITSNGYNLSSDGTCNFNGTGDLNNTDPKLGQLGNYGGPTQTIPLLSGSPATDAGNPSGCTDSQGHLLKTDQRGKPRPDKEDSGGCDMGAYERQND
jgi:hypothetical protein